MQKSKNIVYSVDKAFNILEIIVGNKHPMSLKELSAITGYPKSTVHKLLATMVQHDVICQDCDGMYMLGRRLFEYGISVYNSWDFIQLTHPYLAKICTQTGLNAILGTLTNGCLVNVNFRLGSDSKTYNTSFVGARSPLHATAQGKVFLASFDEKKVRKIIEKEGMKKYTENTITNFDVLLSELSAIKKSGYAIGNSEFNENVRVLSVPVYSKDGHVEFALGVLGKTQQIKDTDVHNIVAILKIESKKMSKFLDI